MISPIQEPTDWVSSMIATKKPDGNIRLCIDPHHLNRALKRKHYPLPVIEEILSKLSKAKVFSKVDLKEGFLQVELDEESSKLTNCLSDTLGAVSLSQNAVWNHPNSGNFSHET